MILNNIVESSLLQDISFLTIWLICIGGISDSTASTIATFLDAGIKVSGNVTA